jgi:serine/threonine-protein kinase
MCGKHRVLDSTGVVGRSLGNYRLLEVLGQGGMGVVYRGEHSLLGRKAAIKVLRSELSKRADIVARFFNEARATSQVSHPSIVSCLDFGHDRGGSAYIVMELLEGESLRDRLDREECIPWTRAVTIAKQVASALGAAHDLGVVHRDLKPDNVYLVEDPDVVGGERAKVLDFGIAKLADDTGVASVFRTRTGSLIGTPIYMSPEQCRGAGEVDKRTDIYSLGCVLYQMVCGRPPFVGAGHGDLIIMHMTVPPKPPRMLEPSVPEWLEQVILRMLAKKPDDRYGDMAEVTADLERLVVMPGMTPIPTRGARMATGTPPPGTTMALSAFDSMTPTTFAPPRRSWLWPLAAAVVLATGGVAFALAAQLGDQDVVAPVAERSIEAPPTLVERAAPPVEKMPVDPPPLVESAAPPPAPVEVAPAADERPKTHRARKKPVREAAPKAKADRATRVRGGIAEPEF